LKDWPTKRTLGLAVTVINFAGPMFFFCCAMINFLLILNAIVTEKEFKLRHGMQMMGLMVSNLNLLFYFILFSKDFK